MFSTALEASKEMLNSKMHRLVELEGWMGEKGGASGRRESALVSQTLQGGLRSTGMHLDTKAFVRLSRPGFHPLFDCCPHLRAARGGFQARRWQSQIAAAVQ